jgi:ELWxxDGT repeat protein
MISVILVLSGLAGFFLLNACGNGGGDGNVELLFFPGDDTASGNFELWSYDGVSAPNKVAEIRSGPVGSDPYQFTAYNGNVYFSARTDEEGLELWTTDGSSAWLVTDLNTGGASSNPQDLLVKGDRLYFRTSNPDALWKTDGTGSGTEEIAGPSHPFNFNIIRAVAPYGSGLVFTGTSSRGSGLYISDGSAIGTTVLDIGFRFIGDVAAFGGTILFGAGSVSTGQELWGSDGTAGAGTLIKEIETGETGSGPSSMVVLGNKVVFEAFRTTEGDELWESDATASGTTLVADINGNPDTSLLFDEIHLHEGKVYFTANETSNDAEPWSYDGISAPQRVADINSGPDGSWGTIYQSFNGLLYISAFHPNYDNEMWVTDGTAMGTTLAFDLAPSGSGVLGD